MNIVNSKNVFLLFLCLTIKNYGQNIELENRAKNGNTEALNEIAWNYYEGRNGYTLDEYKAIELFEKSANLNDVNAIFTLGKMYYYGTSTLGENEITSLSYFKKISDYYSAQYYIGQIYYNDGDYKNSLYWWSKSAEGDNPDSLNGLGELYRFGYGVPKNIDQANDYYKRAAEAGNSHAQYRMARYYEGIGNYKETVKWYNLAVEQMNNDAIFGLAVFYTDVQIDMPKAVELYKKGAENNDSDCQVELGVIYIDGYRTITGIVLPKDLKKAAYWLKKALDNKDKEAKGLLDEYDLWKYL